MKVNPKDLTRPDKLLMKGIHSLSSLSRNLYTNQKAAAKAKAELTFIGRKKLEKVLNQLYEYNLESYNHKENITDFNYLKSLGTEKNYWLNFHGIHEVPTIENIGKILQLDRLMVRYILDTTQRSKVELDEGYLFLSIKSILKIEAGELNVEHLSFILGPNFLVSFQEEKADHFESIRYKIKDGVGFIRKRTIDYLLMQMLDAILDNYFETIDIINQEIHHLEKVILKNPDEKTTLALETHKRSAQIIKKSLGPFKEVLLNILNEKTVLIRKENIRYCKDLVNSVTSATEEIDNTLKTLDGLTNIYFASLSQKMNEIMKVLTTVATIFIPLTFHSWYLRYEFSTTCRSCTIATGIL
jgi:magnesium transporter